MATTAANIINRVKIMTADSDESLRRWTDDELLLWVSDGQKTMSTIKPDLCQKIESIALVSGTRQSLPADGISLLGVIRNMGRSGTTPGRAIRVVLREIMDTQNPDWHSDPKVLEVRNYVYDPMDSTQFYVSPPSNGQGYVDAHFNYTPADVTATSDVLSIPNNYTPALVDYVLWRAHSKDSDFAAGMAKAESHKSSFIMIMSGGNTAELEANPNMKVTPLAPTPKQRAQ